MLARKNSRLVSSPASHHGLAKSIISSDFRVVFRVVFCFILRTIVYEERRAFGMVRKITARKEILDWKVCQVTVTESTVVFLQSRGSIYIFTDSLFFFRVYLNSLAFVFSESFPKVFREVRSLNGGHNQEFRFRLIADGFAFFLLDNTSLLEGL